MLPNSNFEDWKQATEQNCIHDEITSFKIPTLKKQIVITMSFLSIKTSYNLFLANISKVENKMDENEK